MAVFAVVAASGGVATANGAWSASTAVRVGGRTTIPRGSSPSQRPSVEPSVAGNRSVEPVTVGGLTIDPAPRGAGPAPLGMDRAEARAYAGFTGGLGGSPSVIFGFVTLRGVSMPDGVPALDDTAAWVGVVRYVNQGGFNCPDERGTPQSARPFQPEDRAVIFYGGDGRGAVLYDTGGTAPCTGALTAPTVAIADALVPVRWHQQGPPGLATTISYRAPLCAVQVSVGANGNAKTGINTVTVVVAFPFARSGCAAVKTFTTTVRVYPVSVGPGAPPAPTHVVLVPSVWPDFVPAVLVGPIPSD